MISSIFRSILNNNCNMGYAFINFIHRAYILDFYYKYDNRRWINYNSEKVCKITYGRYQGKNDLINHHKNTRIGRSNNNKVRPMIRDTPHVNEFEIKEILDKYYKKRFKEKAVKSAMKGSGPAKTNIQPKPEIAETGKEEVPQPKEFKVEDSQPAMLPELERSKHSQKAYQIFEKRNSQAESQNKPVLDESKQSKRHASDDDKGANSEDEKSLKPEHEQKVSKKLKINIKNISMTARGNFSSNGGKE